MILGNYRWVKTVNSKVSLIYNTILIEHKVFAKIYLLPTRQNFQSRLRFEGNNSSTFHNKSSNTVLLATLNLWSNIQIVRTYTLKYNISDSVSLIIRYLDFETLYYYFKHISNKVMCYILNNTKNICFST